MRRNRGRHDPISVIGEGEYSVLSDGLCGIFFELCIFLHNFAPINKLSVDFCAGISCIIRHFDSLCVILLNHINIIINIKLEFMKSIRVLVFMMATWLNLISVSAETPTQLIGFMTTNEEWLNSSDPTAAYGFYGFEPTGQGGFNPLSPVGPDNTWANSGSCYVDGKYYCYDTYGSWIRYTITYRVIDAATWTVTDTKTFTYSYSDPTSEESLSAKNVPCALAYDPIDNTIWAVTHAYSNTESVKLCKVETSSGRLVVVADLPAIRAAACDASGKLFGIGIDNNLYSIGKDGTCFVIGATGFWPTRDSEIKSGATINFRDGKMYWSFFGFASEEDRNYNRNGVKGLLEIDLSTAESKLLFGYPSGQIFSSLAIANAHPLAPDNITDLTFTPDESDYTVGTLSFTVPEVTYSQQQLLGEVAVAFVLDGNRIADKVAMPGEKVSQRIENLSLGMHNVTVSLTSADGHTGNSSSTNVYAGPYTPSVVPDLTLAYDKDSDTATLTWSTPADANGGSGSSENVRYRIERMPGNVVVARSAKGNTFSEKASFPWNAYYYKITPYVGTDYGKASVSNTLKFGAPNELPYNETFDTAASLNPYTLIDANGDGNGSGWDSPEWLYDEQYGCAFYYGKRDITADDWLITPSLNLEEGSVYCLTFKYYAYYGYGSKFRVVVGSEPVVDAMDYEVLYKETVSDFYDRPGITETVYFAPRKGDKFIGFHHISETMEHLSIDDIHVERYCSAEIPGRVSNLTGSKTSDTEVTLSFDMPTETAGQTRLEGPLSAYIFKDGSEEPIAAIDNKNPGERVVWKDENVTVALHTYRVLVSNSVGNGFDTEVTVDLRKGTPVAVSAVKATLVNSNQIYLEWPASTAAVDEEGNPIDVENIRYLVYKPVPDEEGNIEYRLIARDLKDCYYIDSDPRAGLGEGTQYVTYYVAPVNGDDEGYATLSNALLLTESARLPYEESWPNQTMEGGLWFRAYPHGATWYIRYKGYDPMTDAFDGSGVASCEADRDMPFGSGTILSPRMDLSVVESPELTFYIYQSPKYSDGVQLAVAMDWGDGMPHMIPGAVYNARAEEEGWKKITIPLDDYTDHNSVSVAFIGYVMPENTLHIDKVSVTGIANEKEVALTGVKSPAECRTGVPVTIDVDLANVGSAATGSFKVEMTAGGNTLATEDVAAMQPGATNNISFTYNPADEDAGKIMDLGFNIVNTGESDTNTANNSLAAKIDVKRSNSYRVSELRGAIADNAVELQWNVPDEAEFPETFIDDVESYRSFAIDNVGAWTMHDGDQAINYLMADNVGNIFEWENCREKQAFIVFDTEEFGLTLQARPISGTKYFAAWPAAGVQNDDWLISPELPGCAQLISFYARSLNAGSDAIEIHVSDSDTDRASFVNITGAKPIEIGTEWTLYHFALPEGTRHFAIRYVGNDGEGIMIDDIMYFGTPVSTPDGYNIYRNGVKLNTSLIEGLSFGDTDIQSGQAYRYQVAPVYNGIEMAKSNELLIETSAIGMIGEDAAAIVNPVHGGVEIIGAQGKSVAVYAIDGKCMASVVASDRQRIDLQPGIYVVSVGTMKVKVAVR